MCACAVQAGQVEAGKPIFMPAHLTLPPGSRARSTISVHVLDLVRWMQVAYLPGVLPPQIWRMRENHTWVPLTCTDRKVSMQVKGVASH